MTETKVYCDHCGKQIDAMKDYQDVQIELPSETLYVDLCRKCSGELLKQVKAFCGKERINNDTQ